jgi:ribonucleoside-diphosphate reductase alpha chain
MDGKPFEIFLNTKNTDHIQWTSALTRVISAVFRKGGEVAFLADELRSVSDPNGGYFNGSRLVPSLISEIGDVLKQHIGDVKQSVPEKEHVETEKLDTAGKTLCKACREVAVVREGGCAKCLSCGESKCG